MKSRSCIRGGFVQKWPPRLRIQRAAFTLIELLVVISIIAVLVALFLPAFGNIKIKALQARSAGNLRQIGIAVRLFAAEHDGKVPQFGYPAGKTYGHDAGKWVNPEGPSRGLFPTTNLVLGHHPLGGGDYAKSAAIFYSPLLSKIAGKIRADAYYIDPADGRPKIGYFVHSLPGQSTAQVPPRNPVIYKNQLIANTSVLNWGRTPLYSDFHGITATDYGFQGTEFLVLHLDGAVSVLNRKVAEKLRLTDEGQFYYYLATGEEP